MRIEDLVSPDVAAQLAGKYPCPVEECAARFSSVGDKRRHLRGEHPETTSQKH